ncbi:SRPBCC family protein [Glycomyces tarimensis]
MSDLSRIEVDQFLRFPPARVWSALTEKDKLARWLMPNDFALRVGHRFTFTTAPDADSGFDGVIDCEVLDFEVPRHLRIRWRGGGLDTIVTWTLTPEANGTRLFIEHSGFDPDDPTQHLTRSMLDGGWRSHLVRRLAESLEEDSGEATGKGR